MHRRRTLLAALRTPAYICLVRSRPDPLALGPRPSALVSLSDFGLLAGWLAGSFVAHWPTGSRRLAGRDEAPNASRRRRAAPTFPIPPARARTRGQSRRALGLHAAHEIRQRYETRLRLTQSPGQTQVLSGVDAGWLLGERDRSVRDAPSSVGHERSQADTRQNDATAG